MTKKSRALVLFSGGLDSILAVKVLELQGIEVTGVCFTSNFFDSKKAEQAAVQNNISIKIVDISQDILELVKNPPSGYGKNMNPCIDCHCLMIKKAGEIMLNEKYDFIATGEVLGQRPFSQNKDALGRIIEMTGLEILRPLSAKLLPETKIEKDGLVNRNRLLNIRGRGRDKQIELAKKFDIKDFPSPAGGCLLTDPIFSERLIKMLDYWFDCSVYDVELLKFGRIHWFSYDQKNSKKVLIVVGRKNEDNEQLVKLSGKKDVIMELDDIAGPTTLIKGKNSILSVALERVEINIPDNLSFGELNIAEPKKAKEILDIAMLLTGYYSVKARGKKVGIKLRIVD